MADRDADPAQASAGEPSAEASGSCLACRGSGKVTSNLGGEPQTVDCPWCEGTGERLSEHDAQARRREQQEKAQAEEPPSSEAQPRPPAA